MSIKYKIAPSILASDFTRLGEEVQAAEEAGADLLHCDVMDGHFVPNISFGPMIVEAVRRVTDLPLDVHLMIENPEKYLEMTAKAGATMINVHIETCPKMHDTLEQIRKLNVQTGIAINPDTPAEAIREFIPSVDRILVMTVQPGFGGQQFMTDVLPKLKQIADYARKFSHDIEIAVDGGIDALTVGRAIAHGANVLIAGNSVFKAKGGIASGIRVLREIVALR